MQDKRIQELPIDAFDRLAREQVKRFPDLLFFRSEEDIVNDFYSYYKRLKRDDLGFETSERIDAVKQ